MDEVNRWLLPDGLEEALPAAARRLEHLRRAILDQFDVWGYDLVMPPMAEYLDSLLIGTGRELDLQTFKLTDQLTGKLMGVRADLTPQVARIDAHRLREPGTTRLCYVGTVLRTRADEWSGSRSPLQAGAELFGHDGLDSDVEIIRLMLATLERSGVREPSIDLGHVDIYRSLARMAGLDPAQEAGFFELLQRKALPEIEQMLAEWRLDAEVARQLRALVDLNGGPEVLTEARSVLAAAPVQVAAALEHLAAVVERLHAARPGLDIHVDLGELRGYSYHTGLVFAAFVPGSGQEIARGGRYNHIGRVFGRARAATGFSTDLKQLIRLVPVPADRAPDHVLAPAEGDAGLEAAIAELRARGVRVRRVLAGESTDTLTEVPRLQKRGEVWTVEES
ncbi:ATP phosphoribosyltransferase regulatory subunit [Thioalkalivibrio nitratireducens DSM 14787]|uniref:ATP phosphoribosyltransferase regulatory subunit n=1 Tax=Thioalkalivibrio nitratireducens (strain DSM 14787 / UNIQEM 213 / ALEN2) TaxID=1255043 RepID=L0E2Q6_THIND|nr:ATP phosphoribosyltransferase regulatory subunit [Thioalkalivibrio nitratireducens]AGA34901.1 ATP phosphoribosyltransferase regulatory subunit [Thioalkalivibrio nitratireducens DSM 14787]